ncbi:MAG: redoxin domain-containing protein [Anaerolineae bacterium]|nr:redoxin domain-containing protein [Anaerolineae bacterium]
MLTPSITPLLTGSFAPDFTLIEVVSRRPMALSDLRCSSIVINFWSVDCPWSRYYDDYFLDRAALWARQQVTLTMIASNHNETIEQMQDMADAYGITSPILHDENNVVADAFGAQTTPHIFVIDATGLIVYQGAIDDRTFRRLEPTTNYLDAAVEALTAGRNPATSDTPAYGCRIVRI